MIVRLNLIGCLLRMINMLDNGKTRVLSFISYTIHLKQLMGVSPGDKLYALKRGMYFTLMTQDQYDKLLDKYDEKIKAISDSFEQNKLVNKRTQISVFKKEYTVSKDGSVRIGGDFASSFNLEPEEKLLVHRTEAGYNFWRLNSFRSYFPDGGVFGDDEASSNGRGSSDVRESWCSYNSGNSTCIFGGGDMIGNGEEENIWLTRKDGFLEIRTDSEYKRLISEFRNAISRAKDDGKNDLAKLLYDMVQDIINNSRYKSVNSEGRIYIPIKWARECAFCDESSTVVCCEINEEVVRIVPAHRYDAYLASRKNGEGKPR